MAGFDAGSAVEALDYNFTTVKVADEHSAAILKGAKGTVPEPSQDALEEFQETMRATAADSGVGRLAALAEGSPTEEVIEAMSELPEGAIQSVTRTLTEAVAKLCAGSPSAEQIEALPARHRTAFIGWLVGSLVGPTQPTAASTPSLVGANGVGPTT